MHAPLSHVNDKNLRLAVIDRLTAADVLPAFEKTEFLRKLDGHSDDEYCEEIADALLAIPVTAEQCASIRELYWEAGRNDIIFDIWTFWDGECGKFDVRSFDGLAAVLPDLESLSVFMCAVSDLSPLAGFTGLRELHLSGATTISDISPLARLGSLRSLALDALDPGSTEALASLAGLPLERLELEARLYSDTAFDPYAAYRPSDGTFDPHAVPPEQEPLNLAPLESMTSLRALKLSGDARLTDISPLAWLGSLRSLELAKLDARNADALQPLAGSPLECLKLETSSIYDTYSDVERYDKYKIVETHEVNYLAPLELMTSLRELKLRGDTRIFDISSLAGLHSLRRLDLSTLDPRNADILLPLAGLPLEHLSLVTYTFKAVGQPGVADSDAVNLAPLEHMTSLQTLYVATHTIAVSKYSACEPPARIEFDNARVLEVLKARGVKVDVV